MTTVNTAPTLKDLPSSPAGKTGWPWTEQTEPLPKLRPDGLEWPRISIVTPNYNYGQFLEETIRSVLLQGYPNLEYIVIDGDSTDNSVEIIEKYQPWLSYWVSEKDKGQSSAINKGIKNSTGKIFNWLNSDDIFSISALFNIASVWAEKTTVLVGACEVATTEKSCFWIPEQSICPLKLALYCQGKVGMAQPSTFISLDRLKLIGGVNEALHYVMDYALYLDLLLDEKFVAEHIVITDRCLSIARLHEESKTSSSWNCFEKEMIQVLPALMPKFSSNEQKVICHRLQQLKTQVSVREALQHSGEIGLIRLIKLLFESPSVFYSRFYLGALRKRVMEILS